jgi:predicted ester cyclase
MTCCAGLDVEALLALWDVPPSTRSDAHGDFAAAYADPVLVNDRPTHVAELVARAEALHAAFSDQSAELLEVVATDHHLAFAFRREGTHTGTWATPLGDVPATGARVVLSGIDILTVEGGKVTAIRVLADDLAVLGTAARLRLTERP